MANRIFMLVAILAASIVFAIDVSPAGERFTDNGDGTVTDHTTGLMWAKYDNNGDINYHDAKLYCENIILSQYNDWRMPTIDELKSLFISDKDFKGYETVCGLDVKVNPIIQLSCGWAWAAETKTITAYVFNFSHGYRYLARKAERNHYRAIPVRYAN